MVPTSRWSPLVDGPHYSQGLCFIKKNLKKYKSQKVSSFLLRLRKVQQQEKSKD